MIPQVHNPDHAQIKMIYIDLSEYRDCCVGMLLSAIGLQIGSEELVDTYDEGIKKLCELMIDSAIDNFAFACEFEKGTIIEVMDMFSNVGKMLYEYAKPDTPPWEEEPAHAHVAMSMTGLIVGELDILEKQYPAIDRETFKVEYTRVVASLSRYIVACLHNLCPQGATGVKGLIEMLPTDTGAIIKIRDFEPGETIPEERFYRKLLRP